MYGLVDVLPCSLGLGHQHHWAGRRALLRRECLEDGLDGAVPTTHDQQHHRRGGDDDLRVPVRLVVLIRHHAADGLLDQVARRDIYLTPTAPIASDQDVVGVVWVERLRRVFPRHVVVVDVKVLYAA
eukprot:scaffold23090_cov65-Phaeocystis_antarctica.AAC.12